MARRVFYSFHYVPDCWRTSQVRNIGAIEGNKPASDYGNIYLGSAPIWSFTSSVAFLVKLKPSVRAKSGASLSYRYVP